MPFHLYEGQSGRLIATVLRAGKTPTAREIIALLRRVVRRIRSRWPRVRLMLRVDSRHTKPAVLDWLEANGLDYALGYAGPASSVWRVRSSCAENGQQFRNAPSWSVLK